LENPLAIHPRPYGRGILACFYKNSPPFKFFSLFSLFFAFLTHGFYFVKRKVTGKVTGAICDVPLFWEKGGGRKRDGA
jgi:hypothetical protein